MTPSHQNNGLATPILGYVSAIVGHIKSHYLTCATSVLIHYRPESFLRPLVLSQSQEWRNFAPLRTAEK